MDWPESARKQQELMKIKDHLDARLRDEGVLWAQKLRIQWIQSGDRNMKIFHLSTITRREKDKIHSIRENRGRKVEERGDIDRVIRTYFQHFFTSSNPTVEDNERITCHIHTTLAYDDR